MLRYWILALVLAGTVSNVAEARGRHRVVRYQTNSYQTHAPVYYTNGTNQFVNSQNFVNRNQQQIQPVSYNSTSGATFTQGNSMQAWAEEEARMMASRGTCGHVRPAPMGYFVGVGCGTTCIGSGRLVAEAHYQGKMVRVWQR